MAPSSFEALHDVWDTAPCSMLPLAPWALLPQHTQNFSAYPLSRSCGLPIPYPTAPVQPQRYERCAALARVPVQNVVGEL
jgi:hypothetical protein